MAAKSPKWAAHPRSRGENLLAGIRSRPPTGSSPLTRGKPRHGRNRSSPPRLIPAHAGKTSRRFSGHRQSTAHPRSRGENGRAAAADFHQNGSSPLTRGKRNPMYFLVHNLRLIPAHAGKTPFPWPQSPRPAAHPRSRGENSRRILSGVLPPGSSPLTRGKLITITLRVRQVRLIPAHAGKTQCLTAA